LEATISVEEENQQVMLVKKCYFESG